MMVVLLLLLGSGAGAGAESAMVVEISRAKGQTGRRRLWVRQVDKGETDCPQQQVADCRLLRVLLRRRSFFCWSLAKVEDWMEKGERNAISLQQRKQQPSH